MPEVVDEDVDLGVALHERVDPGRGREVGGEARQCRTGNARAKAFERRGDARFRASGDDRARALRRQARGDRVSDAGGRT